MTNLTGRGMLLACLLLKSPSLYFTKCLACSRASFFLSKIYFFFCKNLLSSEASFTLFSYILSCLLLLLRGLGRLTVPFFASRLCGLVMRWGLPSFSILCCLIRCLLCWIASSKSSSASSSSDLSSRFSPCFTFYNTSFNLSSIYKANSSRSRSPTVRFEGASEPMS